MIAFLFRLDAARLNRASLRKRRKMEKLARRLALLHMQLDFDARLGCTWSRNFLSPKHHAVYRVTSEHVHS